MGIQPGTYIGRYHILEQLGEGGMAVVYKAYDTKLERNVALKVIRTELKDREKFLKRFRREAKALTKLTHPNIVGLIDFDVDEDNNPYIVMEYIPGGNLKSWMNGPIHWQTAVEMLVPIADALGFAHQQGILHRDVKPGNILMTEGGQLMLSDFGVAKVLANEETTDLTTTGMGVGTPEYMAPEQFVSQDIDQRADIYALGVVLYEMVAGRKPFIADTPYAVAIKQSQDPLPPPRNFVKDIPETIERVFYKALAKKPDDRYADMKAFISAMKRLDTKEQTKRKKKRVSIEKTFKVESDGSNKGQKLPGWIWSISILGVVGIGALSYFIFTAIKDDKIPEQNQIVDEGGAVVVNETSALNETTIPISTDTPEIAPIPTLGIGSSMISETDGMTLMYVPAGEFLMGSNQGDDDEKPEHTVKLDAFWIDQTEVTEIQYWLCVADNICQVPEGVAYENVVPSEKPMVFVTCADAEKYCEWTGRRLPTEAEWEKAARGIDGRTFPWGEEFDCNKASINFFTENIDTTGCIGSGSTLPVGSFPEGVSPYLAMDMTGNVAEWIADFYSEGYYSLSPFENPKGPGVGEFRVIRGGSNRFSIYESRAANRYPVNPAIRRDHVGFRCAMDAD